MLNLKTKSLKYISPIKQQLYVKIFDPVWQIGLCCLPTMAPSIPIYMTICWYRLRIVIMLRLSYMPTIRHQMEARGTEGVSCGTVKSDNHFFAKYLSSPWDTFWRFFDGPGLNPVSFNVTLTGGLSPSDSFMRSSAKWKSWCSSRMFVKACCWTS